MIVFEADGLLYSEAGMDDHKLTDADPEAIRKESHKCTIVFEGDTAGDATTRALSNQEFVNKEYQVEHKLFGVVYSEVFNVAIIFF
jgi:hypothetical protein